MSWLVRDMRTGTGGETVDVVDGENARFAIRAAFSILALLIVMIGVLVGLERPVPQEFTTTLAAIIGAVIGFLGGTRVDPESDKRGSKRDE